MRNSFLLFAILLTTLIQAQTQQPPKSPCITNLVYRQFDFWIGDWEVYGLKGKKGGDSKIELILDSCIILENWKSLGSNYSGKSFNTFNSSTNQ